MPLSLPFQTGNLAASGVSTPAPPMNWGSTIMSGVKDVTGLFDNLGKSKVQNAEVQSHLAQAGYYRSEAEAKAAATAHDAARSDALAQANAKVDDVMRQTGDPVAAAAAGRAILAPFYTDKDALQGIQGLGLEQSVEQGVQPQQAPIAASPTAAPAAVAVSPTTAAARDLTFGRAAAMGHAIKSADSSESLTWGENVGRTQSELQRKVDEAVAQSQDRRYAAETSARASMYGSDSSSGAARYGHDLQYDADLRRIQQEAWDREHPVGAAAGPPASETQLEIQPNGQTLRREIRRGFPTGPTLQPVQVPNPAVPSSAPSFTWAPGTQGYAKAAPALAAGNVAGGPARGAPVAAPAMPATAPPSALPPKQQAFSQARQAIAQGADPAKIRQRLIANGYNPAEGGF
jgi:hypothetical protein